MKDKLLFAALITVLLCLAALFAMNAMQPQNGDSLVIRTLKAQGMENIQTAPAMLGMCDDNDIPTSFTATQNEQAVSGVVCVNALRQTAYIRYK